MIAVSNTDKIKMKEKKKKVDGRIKYPYVSMPVGDKKVLTFISNKQRENARCAAHQVGYQHGWRFETEKRMTDAGKFELTVTRIK